MPFLLDDRSDNLPYEKVGNQEPICIADKAPFEIPDSWEWCRVGDFFTIISGLAYKKSNLIEKSSNMIRVLRGGNIGEEEFHLKNDDIFISAKYVKSELYLKRNYMITPAVSSIEHIGKIALVDKDYNDLVVGGFVLMLLPLFDDDIISKYLLYVFATKYHRDNCRGITHKSGQAFYNISREKMMNLPIPIPPREEMHRIIKLLDQAFPKIHKYKEIYTSIQTLHIAFPILLKKSILQQAIQGKLIQQNNSDEPANILLEHIRGEKQQLIKSGKIKKDKHESIIFRRDNSYYEKLDGVERCIDEEIPFEIPDSWEWARLGSIFQINPKNKLPDEIEVGFIPMALLADGFGSHHDYELKKWKDIKKGFTHFANNDIVIAKITPCFQNRKSAIITGLPNEFGAGTTELHVLRDQTKKLFIPYFLFICKTQKFIQDGMERFSGTAGQQRIGKEFISKYLVPVPPYKEQKRIVECINKIFPLISKL